MSLRDRIGATRRESAYIAWADHRITCPACRQRRQDAAASACPESDRLRIHYESTLALKTVPTPSTRVDGAGAELKYR